MTVEKGSAETFAIHCGQLFDGHTVQANAVLQVTSGCFSFVGPYSEWLATRTPAEPTEIIDARSHLVTPGLVDCHTHVVYGGSRANEYEMRAAGASYLEIAAAGGGIKASVASTREATEQALFQAALFRLNRLLDRGVTTVEIKSGYGLDLATELKMLRVMERLRTETPLRVYSTFLGAHTVPSEHKSSRERYVDVVVNEMIPAVAAANLASFCDVFVEQGAFSIGEARRILLAGAAAGLRPKLHADQLSAGGGAELAGEVGAVSADHLEYITDDGIKALKSAGTTAVLLPGAPLFLGQSIDPPARALLDAGVPTALATDCNPGTSMTQNLHLMMTLAMSRFKMTALETFRAVTSHAALALDAESAVGTIAIGRPADFVVFEANQLVDIPYQMGSNLVRAVYIDGKLARSRQVS